MSVLSDGIDGFIKQLKRLPREVKALPLCHVLEEKMKEFKNSIPLFSDLKNEALRERLVINLSKYKVAVVFFHLDLSCVQDTMPFLKLW